MKKSTILSANANTRRRTFIKQYTTECRSDKTDLYIGNMADRG